MAVVSRLIPVNQPNLDNSHFYLTEVRDIFPADVVGGPNEGQAAPRTVRVFWGNESVDTDIVSDKNIFRARAWVRQFFSANRFVPGDMVLLEQLDPYTYRVSKSSTC